MLKTVDELKSFILWAKQQGIKRIKLHDVEIEISDITLATDVEARLNPLLKEERSTSKTLTDTEVLDQTEEDELLMWSAR